MSRRRNVFASCAALLTTLVMVALTVGVSHPASAGLLSNPSIASVSPTVVFPGGNGQVVKIFGTFKNAAATVEFEGAGISIVGAPVTKSTSEINVTVNVAANAPTTARNVTITQEGLIDGGTATCNKCLSVGPVITAVGGPVSNGGSSTSFTVTGHAFAGVTSVNIERKSFGFGAAENDLINIGAAAITIAPDGNSLTASFNPLGRAPGRWKVTLIKPGAPNAVFGDGITTGVQVTGSKPTLATISPARINSSQTAQQFTLTGKGFARGMTATVSGSGVTQAAKIDWTSLTQVTLKLTSSAAPGNGPRTLVLKNADDQSSTNAEAIWVNQDPQALGTPTITSVTPSVLGQGASQVQMIVTGTNFAGPVPTVEVTPNDTDPTKKIDIGVTRDSSTQLTLTVSVGASTPAGARSMVVTNPNGGAASSPKANAFTVSDQFVVTSLSPPGRPRGFTGNFVINGSGFSGSPTVTMNPGTDITIGAVTVNSPAKMTVGVTVGNTAALDPRDVSVTISGTTKTCDDCFTVGLVPTVSSMTPTSANGGSQVSISAINGTNFKNAGATLEREGQNPISLIEVQQTGTTKLSGTFDLTDAAPGKWSLKVTNQDGGSATLADAFTVVLPKPTVTGVTPETVTQATSGVTLTVTGTQFAPGMTVTFPDPGGITITEVTRKSTTSAEVKIATADNARLGARDVKVQNSDGNSGTCTSCFIVVQGTQAKNFGPGVTAFENFNKGAFVAAGSLDGQPLNGTEFVVGANAGGGPHVKPFRVNPVNGNIQELGAGFFAYGSDFPGGVRVAMGDIDGNPANGEEIVTAAGPGGGPHVRVFHLNNDLTINEPFGNGFFAYTPNFSGGVYVATGDVNGDGKDDIITGAGPGGGPHVRIWTLGQDKHSWVELGGYFAYDGAFQGGVYPSAGNVISEAQDAPVKDEVMTVPSYGGGPHVKIFDSLTGHVAQQFFAFDTNDDQGYRITSGDFDFDTVDDVAVGRASSGELYIVQITGAGPIRLVTPNPAPFGTLPTGTNLAAGDVDADGDDDLVLSPDHSSPVTIRLVRPLALA